MHHLRRFFLLFSTTSLCVSLWQSCYLGFSLKCAFWLKVITQKNIEGRKRNPIYYLLFAHILRDPFKKNNFFGKARTTHSRHKKGSPILAFVPSGTGFSGNKEREHPVRFCLGLTLMFPRLDATLNIS